MTAMVGGLFDEAVRAGRACGRRLIVALAPFVAVFLGCGAASPESVDTVSLTAPGVAGPRSVAGDPAGDCTRLAEFVNGQLDETERAAADASEAEPAEQLRALAATLESAARGARAMRLGTAELERETHRYAAMCSTVAGAARALATALEGGDEQARAEAADTLDKALLQERLIVDAINDSCERDGDRANGEPARRGSTGPRED